MTIQQLFTSSSFYDPPVSFTVDGLRTYASNPGLYQAGSTTVSAWGGEDFVNAAAMSWNGQAVLTGLSTYNAGTGFTSLPTAIQNALGPSIEKYQVTTRSRYINIQAWGGGGGSGGSNPTAAAAGNGGAGGYASTTLTLGIDIQPGDFIYIMPGLAGSGGGERWYGGHGGGASVVWTTPTDLVITGSVTTAQRVALSNSLNTSTAILVAGGGGGGGGGNGSATTSSAGNGGGGGSPGSAGTSVAGTGGLPGTATGHGAANALTPLLDRRGVAPAGGFVNSLTQPRTELAWGNFVGFSAWVFLSNQPTVTYGMGGAAGGGVFQGSPGALFNCADNVGGIIGGDMDGNGSQTPNEVTLAGGGGGGSKVYKGFNQVITNAGTTHIPPNASLAGVMARGGLGKGIAIPTDANNLSGRGGSPGRVIVTFYGE